MGLVLPMKYIICVIFLLERSIWWLDINIEKRLFYFISLGDKVDIKCRKVDLVSCNGRDSYRQQKDWLKVG
jgi:hypothetical protein